MTKIKARAAAAPADRGQPRSRARPVTTGCPRIGRGGHIAAVVARAAPRTPSGYRAVPGSPTDRWEPTRSAWRGRRVVAGGRRGGARRPNPRSCRRPTPHGGRWASGRWRAERARRDRAVSNESRVSSSRRTPLTASCGCVRAAPPGNLTVRSGSERAASLPTPTRHNRATGAGAHPQTEPVHAGSAPVVRLEGPLALGHDVLLVVSRTPSGRTSDACPGARLRSVRCTLTATARRGPRTRFGSQPYRRLSGDCLRVLTRLRLVKPGLLQRTRPRWRDDLSRFGLTTPRCRYHDNPNQARSTFNPRIGMQQNGWQQNGKLLASANAVLD